jgi:hypothetical protein
LPDIGPSPARVIGAAPAPRAMTRADVSAFADLFCEVFRDGSRTHREEIAAYLTTCLFENPAYDTAFASMVQEDTTGEVAAVMGFIPIPLIACGREITARLGSAFMARPQISAGAAGRITTLLRAKRQDFVFSSNGAPMTAQSTRAGGGQVLPLQSLDWLRPFRPVGVLANTLFDPQNRRTSQSNVTARLAKALSRPLDALARALVSGVAAGTAAGWQVKPVPRALVLAEAPTMVARFAVRPRWSRDELTWLLDMAAQRQADGPLSEAGVFDDKGHLAGLVFYYARSGGLAQVLNILTIPRAEAPVLRALLAHLDAAGCIGARGEAQPFLMPALAQERGITYRFRGNFCVLTRHQDVADAVARGDFYAGGLVGESWSRLVSDFR